VIEDKKCKYITIAKLSPIKMSDEPYVNMNHAYFIITCYVTNRGKMFFFYMIMV